MLRATNIQIMPSQCNQDSTLSRQNPSSRIPLHQRSDSESNSSSRPPIRLVPKTPPQLLAGYRDEETYYSSRTPRQTPSSHILNPQKRATVGNSASEYTISKFQNPGGFGARSTGLRGSTTEPTPIEDAQTIPNSYPRNCFLLIPTCSSSKPFVRKRQLHIHEDNKTFSLCSPEDEEGSESETKASREGNVMSTTPISIHDLPSPSDQTSSLSLDVRKKHSEQGSLAPLRSNSLCALPIRALNNSNTTSVSNKPKKKVLTNSINSSPCNHEFIGGLRKVTQTPDREHQFLNTSKNFSSLLQRSDEVSSPSVPHDLLSKPSFSSTNSTSSETTNYKIYGEVSASSSTNTIAELSSPRALTESTSPASPNLSLDSQETPPAPQKHHKNYEGFGGSSHTNLSLDQSLVLVSPLKQKAKKQSGRVGNSPFKLRESLHSDSLTSLSSFSLNSKETLRSVLSSKPPVQIPFHQFNLNQSQLRSSSWAETLSLYPPRSHMNEYPHQWSSQLSTVLSVSEGGSDQDTKSWSDDSQNSFDSRGRVMSFGSGRTSQDLISPISRNLSWNESTIDMPLSAVKKPGRSSTSPIRAVSGQDEYGDGITDMYNMRSRQMRRRNSGYISSTSSDNGRTNTMRSSISTQSINLTLSLLPAWAKLYYGGGGERRLLHSSRSSIGGIESRTNSFKNITPSPDLGQTNLRSSLLGNRNNRGNRASSMEINTNSMSLQNGIRRQPSNGMPLATWNVANLWSPHLRPDRRSKRNCMRGPPSLQFGADGGVFGRRNIQVVMFILGFIFPLSWIIASVLPLPQLPVVEMREDDRTSPTLDIFKNEREINAIDEARYESAVWWRKLNRWMSIVGVLIIAAVVVLVVIGLEQGWGVEQG